MLAIPVVPTRDDITLTRTDENRSTLQVRARSKQTSAGHQDERDPSL
jgi:hypothetical protein